MRRSSVFAGIAFGALPLAACVAPSAPPPRPAPPVAIPAPAPTPTPAPPPPASADWRDWPVTPGDWSGRPDGQGGVAAFGGVGRMPELSLRCDRTRGRILLSRAGQAASPSLTIRTTSLSRTLSTAPGTAGAVAELGARDPLIDAMGYSRGRIVVEGGGLPTLVVPAWSEILRVAEDCRG
ncbi:hypothetical protein FHS95_001625 [Sphingomonas naasensis]|uniref:Uncharacterized protein n=1 Tax=Sphingomonas naasensis TaxID=1344951 RepID=A0A4S1W6F6_9SPHN|nr:hypothetical protein [Sphingomonas naasensis]NIJ19956.1 hypothetical protein [Sphingomonas naasensis]TGX37913.1 hypothetical protein E5A74_19255 [Sphingomonas naasensis]